MIAVTVSGTSIIVLRTANSLLDRQADVAEWRAGDRPDV
jgi:hypothetical protein